MPTPAIFRNAKNKIGKYSDSQVKVRNATSNDPGGPSLHALIEIASLSFNPIILDEMLQILIKRLNDDGKNWRHIYKSLKVFEFMAIHGSNYALEFARRNLHYFESLKSFQHFKDSRECGGIIREAATKVVVLLTNDNELQNAKSDAKNVTEAVSRKNQLMKANPLNAQSDNHINTIRSQSSESGPKVYGGNISEELRKAFPASAEEEDCQIQVALALSKEEFIVDEPIDAPQRPTTNPKKIQTTASVDDLLMIDFSNTSADNSQSDILTNITGGFNQMQPINNQLSSSGSMNQMQSSSYFNPFDQGYNQNSQFMMGNDLRNQPMGIMEDRPFSPMHTQRVNTSNDPYFMPQSNNPPLQYPVQNSLYNQMNTQPNRPFNQQPQSTRLPEITPFNTNKPNEKQDPFDFLNDFINTQDNNNFRMKETSQKSMSPQPVQENDMNNPFL